jgi:hypothetical protein
MKIFLISISIFLFFTSSGYPKIIQFNDFDWGMPLVKVESLASEKNFILTKKELSAITLFLKYDNYLYGRECVITFFFTPLGQKLYHVKVEWESPTFGDFVKSMVIKEYQYPREEIPDANIYIWTRTNTEMELRYGVDDTALTYSNLDLWADYKDEKELKEEQMQEEDSW